MKLSLLTLLGLALAMDVMPRCGERPDRPVAPPTPVSDVDRGPTAAPQPQPIPPDSQRRFAQPPPPDGTPQQPGIRPPGHVDPPPPEPTRPVVMPPT